MGKKRRQHDTNNDGSEDGSTESGEGYSTTCIYPLCASFHGALFNVCLANFLVTREFNFFFLSIAEGPDCTHFNKAVNIMNLRKAVKNKKISTTCSDCQKSGDTIADNDDEVLKIAFQFYLVTTAHLTSSTAINKIALIHLEILRSYLMNLPSCGFVCSVETWRAEETKKVTP